MHQDLSQVFSTVHLKRQFSCRASVINQSGGVREGQRRVLATLFFVINTFLQQAAHNSESRRSHQMKFMKKISEREKWDKVFMNG